MSAKTGKTTILATLTSGPIRAAYLYSIILRERYVIIGAFDAYYTKGEAKVLWTRNILDAWNLNPTRRIFGL